MEINLLKLKLSTIGLILVSLILVSSFVFLVPATTKQSLVAPDGPFYFLTQTSDLVKDHQTLLLEKGNFLVEMATKGNFEKSEMIFQEYERYHDFYSSRLPESITAQEETLNFSMDQMTMFLSYTTECPEKTLSFIEGAVMMNIELRAKLLEEIGKVDFNRGVNLHETTLEVVMENTPENLKKDMWEYMTHLKNSK